MSIKQTFLLEFLSDGTLSLSRRGSFKNFTKLVISTNDMNNSKTGFIRRTEKSSISTGVGMGSRSSFGL